MQEAELAGVRAFAALFWGLLIVVGTTLRIANNACSCLLAPKRQAANFISDSLLVLQCQFLSTTNAIASCYLS
jgi:hypothetical protein